MSNYRLLIIVFNHLCPLLAGTVSAALWASLYFFLRHRLKERSPEFVNRLVTAVHGTLVTILGSRECFVGGWVYSQEDHGTSTVQQLILRASLGYFIFDLIWCLYYKTETNLMIGHHVYSIVALFRLLARDYNGGPATCALGGMEATNPLLQLRWFVRTFDYHNTWMFTVVEWSFIVAFIFLRIIVGTVIMAYVLFGVSRDWEFLILAVVIYMVSWAFVINIFKYINKKYLKDQLGDERYSIVTEDTRLAGE